MLHLHLTVFPVFVRIGISYRLNAEYAPPLCEKIGKKSKGKCPPLCGNDHRFRSIQTLETEPILHRSRSPLLTELEPSHQFIYRLMSPVEGRAWHNHGFHPSLHILLRQLCNTWFLPCVGSAEKQQKSYPQAYIACFRYLTDSPTAALRISPVGVIGLHSCWFFETLCLVYTISYAGCLKIIRRSGILLKNTNRRMGFPILHAVYPYNRKSFSASSMQSSK